VEIEVAVPAQRWDNGTETTLASAYHRNTNQSNAQQDLRDLSSKYGLSGELNPHFAGVGGMALK